MGIEILVKYMYVSKGLRTATFVSSELFYILLGMSAPSLYG